MSSAASSVAGRSSGVSGLARHAIELFASSLWEEALAEFDRALASETQNAELHNYRARTLDQLGRTEEALLAIDCALRINPANHADWKNRGVLLRRLGRLAQALESFETALARLPGSLEARLARALLLVDLDRRDEALGECQRALLQFPENLEALNARGRVFESLGRYGEALADFDRMLEIDPRQVDAKNNRAMILARQGEFPAALTLYSESLTTQPEQTQAFYNRSLVRLALGDWAIGLREFEVRWQLPLLKDALLPTRAPIWLGQESLVGKTLLVHHEQGYGDTLQCVRYVPRLVAQGARVILAVPPALQRLMVSLPCECRVVSVLEPLPEHDLQCPLMSLLLAFETTPESIPEVGPYLRSAGRLHTRRPLEGSKRRRRIGLAWSGRRYAPVNYPRDMTLAMLRPLFDLDAQFVSLQQDMCGDDTATLAALASLDSSSVQSAQDFAATAALIDTLDLVISVDTAIAHLAGAMGKPVWLMNRYASCWRWLQTGTQTKWYASMRIFRQPTVGDWGAVVVDVLAAALELTTGAPRIHASSLASATARGVVDNGRTVVSLPQAGSLKSNELRRTKVAAPTIRLVCATRHTRTEFFAKSPLGRSLPLYQNFPRHQRIELRLFANNAVGLPSVYNVAIEEARQAPAILVFIHDDLHLSDYFWADRLREGLDHFDIVGLAGNKRRVARQTSWMYLNKEFNADSFNNLSGVLGHGEGFPNLTQLSVYGEPCQEVKLLDGVLIAVRSEILIEKDLRFDEQFTFDFYDLDFCRQAEARAIRMGTWAISAIHASAGKLGGCDWQIAYKQYLSKYGEL